MRIGVLGGTFDPPHLGHLIVASEVADSCGLDRVVFSPTGHSWHKSAPTIAPGDARLAMVEALIGSDPRFEVSRVDLDRSGPTYSVDTLADLQAQFASRYPGEVIEFTFILGADALAEIWSWHEPMRLLQLAHLVGVTRPGHDLAAPDLPAGSYSLVEVPAIEISSTDIRARLAAGRTIAYLVPDSVRAVIDERGLYRGTQPDHGAPSRP